LKGQNLIAKYGKIGLDYKLIGKAERFDNVFVKMFWGINFLKIH
jgi:hypothetical protein